MEVNIFGEGPPGEELVDLTQLANHLRRRQETRADALEDALTKAELTGKKLSQEDKDKIMAAASDGALAIILDRVDICLNNTKSLLATSERDPYTHGLADGAIALMNILNGTEFKSVLKQAPEKGYTHFSPVSVPTDPHPETFLLYKEKNSDRKVQLILKEFRVKHKEQVIEHLLFKKLDSTDRYVSMTLAEFKRNYEPVKSLEGSPAVQSEETGSASTPKASSEKMSTAQYLKNKEKRKRERQNRKKNRK
jgi:hypothetical protein